MNDAVDTLWCCLIVPWMGNKKFQLNPGKMNWLCGASLHPGVYQLLWSWL